MSTAVAGRAASFGQRALAWTLDMLLLSPLLAWLAWAPLARAFAAAFDWLVQVQAWMLERMLAADELVSPLATAQALLADPVQGAAAQAQVAQLTGALVRVGLVLGAATAAWFVGFEASAWQATPGKRLLGLRVQALDGARPTLARALARHVAGLASWLTLNLGHLLVALRADGRALHDLIAGTQVRADGPLPARGRAAFALVVAVALLAPVAGVLWVLGRLAGI